jgi:hypothetical protein
MTRFVDAARNRNLALHENVGGDVRACCPNPPTVSERGSVTRRALLLTGAPEKSNLFANFGLQRLAESRSTTPRRVGQHARQETLEQT